MPSPTAPPPGCRFHTRCPHARARCSSERPTLQEAGGDRQVACHFWSEVIDKSAGIAGVPPASPEKQSRFALYKAWRERQEQAHSAQ